MEKYILQLIQKNNRVIVPNYGAFIVSRDAGTTVLFNNFLSFNDGLLVNHVSHETGVSNEEALAKISEYVAHVKQKLEAHDEYTIAGLGKFTRDKSGILRFSQSPEVAELFANEPPAEAEKNEEPGLLDIDSNAPEVAETDPETIYAEEPEPSKPYSKDEPLLTLDGVEKKPDQSDQEPTTESVAEPYGGLPPTTGLDAPPLTPVASRRKTILPPWAIALIILIPIIIVALYFFLWNSSNNDNQVTRTAPVEDTVKQAIKTENSPGDSNEIISTEPGTTPSTTTGSEKALTGKAPSTDASKKGSKVIAKTKPYHIIVGSFQIEANALKKAKSMNARGYKEASHFPNNGMHVVSILTFGTLKEAQAAREDLIKLHQTETWILLKR